jgi:hypothetical protein
MIARMTSSFPSGLVRVLGRSVLAAALASVLLCASAGAQTVGYLYTAIGGNIGEFEVGADTSLTSAGSRVGGPTTIEYPGTLVMAKTADGENLYELAGTGKTETIYQYSVGPTGALTDKTPVSVGSIPLLGSEEQHMMAVFNPAAKGEAGQNALYVLSGASNEQAVLYMFDIDATSGALTSAGEIDVPEIKIAVTLAYSGNVLAIEGRDTSEDEGFQSAVIDAPTGTPVFDSLPDAPCPPYFCSIGQAYMLSPEQMLIASVVPNPNSKVPGEEVGGYTAYEVGTWNALGSSAGRRGGGLLLTGDGHEYLAIERQTEFEALSNAETFTGEVVLQTLTSDGLSEGYTALPEESSKVTGPLGIFSLGSGLYIANEGVYGLSTGGAYRLSSNQPPVSTELDATLGTAMTGFLLAGSEGTGPGGGSEGPGPGGGSEGPGPGGPNSGETPAGSSTNGGNTGAPAAGGLIKPGGSQVKAIGLTGGGSAKLGSGVIKLDVTCGLPCTVSGFVLPPGAKAASAHKKPKALPFKSIRLAGSGEPVVVTLRFTPAQKKLATSLLRKHEKVTANITVTEAPGGAAPQSTSIKIT